MGLGIEGNIFIFCSVWLFIDLIILLFVFVFLGPRPQHVEVPRLRVKLEL